jgi:hypothetical protein
MSPTPATAIAELPPGADVETEYRSIEQALLESAVGRWFLAEHSRRARRLDSARLDEALGKLQSSLRQPPALLGQLKAEVSKLRSEVASARAKVLSKPTTAADEPAPAAILKSVEALHQMAWNLQAAPVDQGTCERIAQHAATIYAQSVAQAAQSKRASDVASSLDSAIAQLDGILRTITLEGELEASGKATG